ncbi:transcription factor IBH1-like 1 [Phragmites australis]|uniref:transcription factor IBH1-like 1 n=1 Tax=Phragmites australis TaxID=29695 RepID=UPI002D7900CA|nr:transcription factor IBH1-like 1 [Phragmites australis]
MQGPSTSKNTMAAFKQDFLKNLLLSLRERTEARSFHAMSLQERKRAVKSSADVSMAAARGATGGSRLRWAKVILAAAAAAAASSNPSCKLKRCRRVVRRCCLEKRSRGCAPPASAMSSDYVARRMVRRRTMALRKVIPGGDAAMDEASLLREAMDYVVHLRAQVDVLRRVSEAARIQLPPGSFSKGT